MRAFGVYVCLLVASAAPATAQLTTPTVGTGLMTPPASDAPDNRKVSDYLRAAQIALAAGRGNEVQEALEMAQTRLLDRSVPLGQTNNPSNELSINQITQARQALRTGDRGACMEFIQSALASATAQGL
jgi:hypothetical protein